MYLQALSAVGRCQTFEAAADGYGRGEGCSVVLLQQAAMPGDVVAILQVCNINSDCNVYHLMHPQLIFSLGNISLGNISHRPPLLPVIFAAPY